MFETELESNSGFSFSKMLLANFLKTLRPELFSSP